MLPERIKKLKKVREVLKKGVLLLDPGKSVKCRETGQIILLDLSYVLFSIPISILSIP
jgi:hypothetical protein